MAPIHEVAAAVAAYLSPFMPFLVDTAKAGGTKLAEAIAEHGGEAAWKRAVAVWEALRGDLGEPAEVRGAALMLSADVENEDYRRTLATVLARHLEGRPEVAERLAVLLRDEPSSQTVAARSGSVVENVDQLLAGAGGTQHVEATGGSGISGVRQRKISRPEP